MTNDALDAWVRARSAFSGKDWDCANRHLDIVLAANHEHQAALLMSSIVQLNLGNYRSARSLVLRLHSLGPMDPKIISGMLGQLRTVNEASLVVKHFEEMRSLDAVSIPLLLSLAAQLSYLNCQSQALRLLDEARRADPDYPPMLIARAQVLIYLGRFDDARLELNRCIGVAPELASAYWLLSRINESAADGSHVDVLRQMLRSGCLGLEQKVFCGFALHNELDLLGEHADAWDSLEIACQTKRNLLVYNDENTRAMIDALTAISFQRLDSDLTDVHKLPMRIPVFIVGMHRSGTTLLEQLLDTSPQVRAVGELYDFTSAMRYGTDHHCKGVIDATIVARAGAVDFPEVGRRYLEGMAWRLGEEPFFTDKLPSNFLNIGFICRALPQAKILHMVRDPMETCFSNLRELFSEANPYSYDQRELADYFIQYRRLMAHWHRAFPGRILDVDYARLTEDPAAVMREVAAFCGIKFIDAMTDTCSSTRAVATASAVQVRDGVRKRAVPKWVPYARHLQPLREALQAGGIEIGSAD